MLTNKQVLQKIKNAKNVAIFSHRNPDPDAFGASFGMKGLCESLGINASVFMSSCCTTELQKIFPCEQVCHDFKAKDFDLVIVVDLHIERLLDEEFLAQIKKSKEILVIDHHPYNKDEDIISDKFHIETLASASQLVANLFIEAGITPSKEVAEYIYAGVMGDTARFLHSNVDKKVFDCATYLLSCGADIQKVYDAMFRSRTKDQIIANKFFLNNLKYLDKIGYIIFTKKDLKKMGVNVEDIKIFTNEITSIDGVFVSFFCYEKQKNVYKVSLRCRKGIVLDELAIKMGGGGHVEAAAFEIKTTKRKLQKLIPIWAKEILNG